MRRDVRSLIAGGVGLSLLITLTAGCSEKVSEEGSSSPNMSGPPASGPGSTNQKLTPEQIQRKRQEHMPPPGAR